MNGERPRLLASNVEVYFVFVFVCVDLASSMPPLQRPSAGERAKIKCVVRGLDPPGAHNGAKSVPRGPKAHWEPRASSDTRNSQLMGPVWAWAWCGWSATSQGSTTSRAAK